MLERITLDSLGSLIKYKPFSCTSIFLFSCRISVPAHTCLRCNFFPLINLQTLLDTTAVMFAKYCNANGALLISHCLLTISNIGLLSVDFPRSLKHSTLLGLIDILLKLSGFISGLADAMTLQWIGEVPLCLLLTPSLSHWIPLSQSLPLIEMLSHFPAQKHPFYYVKEVCQVHHHQF